MSTFQDPDVAISSENIDGTREEDESIETSPMEAAVQQFSTPVAESENTLDQIPIPPLQLDEEGDEDDNTTIRRQWAHGHRRWTPGMNTMSVEAMFQELSGTTGLRAPIHSADMLFGGPNGNGAEETAVPAESPSITSNETRQPPKPSLMLHLLSVAMVSVSQYDLGHPAFKNPEGG